MKTRCFESVALGSLMDALTESALSLLGDNEAAYQVIACALADLLGNGDELVKKLEQNH